MLSPNVESRLAILSKKSLTIEESIRETFINHCYKLITSDGKWVLPRMLFCPICMKEDETPFFRLEWRLLMNFICLKHKVYLLDQCSNCKREINLTMRCDERYQLSICPYCNNDLSLQPSIIASEPDIEIQDMLHKFIYKSIDDRLDFMDRYYLSEFFRFFYGILRGMVYVPIKTSHYHYQINLNITNFMPYTASGLLEKVRQKDLNTLLSYGAEKYFSILHGDSPPRFITKHPLHAKTIAMIRSRLFQ